MLRASKRSVAAVETLNAELEAERRAESSIRERIAAKSSVLKEINERRDVRKLPLDLCSASWTVFFYAILFCRRRGLPKKHSSRVTLPRPARCQHSGKKKKS